MKKQDRKLSKLSLAKETLRTLDESLLDVAGGVTVTTYTHTCGSGCYDCTA